MEHKIILIVMGMFMISLVSAGALDLVPAKQLSKTDVLDENYVVKNDGVYFKDLLQDDPVVWIDKKVGTTYHVDSTKDFNRVLNESVTLEFFYDIQPDFIAHYTHSGEFDRYYFPTQWTWVANCVSEYECDGGWVTIEVQNIEKGTGSSTFPIGVTGPTWAYEGEFYGDSDGTGNIITIDDTAHMDNFNETDGGITISTWTNVQGIGAAAGIGWSNMIGKGTSGKWEWELRYVNATKDYSFVVLNSTFTADVCSADTTGTFDFENSKWTYITANYNGTGCSIYVNGSGNDYSNKGSNQYETSDGRISLMSRDITNREYDGFLDEVLIYNRSLSASEITGLYNNYTLTSAGPRLDNGNTINRTGLVLDINFDDYSVQDGSGLENHGTNTNVSFGEVFRDNRTVPSSAYTTSDDDFTITDLSFGWTGMDISYDYYVDANTNNSMILHLIEIFIAISIIGICYLILRRFLDE